MAAASTDMEEVYGCLSNICFKAVRFSLFNADVKNPTGYCQPIISTPHFQING